MAEIQKEFPFAAPLSSKLTQLKPKERATGHYRIKTFRERVRRDGKPYQEIRLTDGEGELLTYAWPERVIVGEHIGVDSEVLVVFHTRMFNGQLIADLDAIDLDAIVVAEPTEPLPTRKRPYKRLVAFLNESARLGMKRWPPSNH